MTQRYETRKGRREKRRVKKKREERHKRNPGADPPWQCPPA